jgi:hypothetical protein
MAGAREGVRVGPCPLRSADRRALAEAAPDETEPLLGIRVADEGVKAALIAGAPDVFPGVMAWQPLTAADLPLLAGWLREPQVARWNHEHTAEAVAGAAHSPRPRDSTQRPCDPRVGAGL